VEILVVLAVLAAVIVVVGSPLRPGYHESRDLSQSAERQELEAMRDAKYREIRDAEMDRRTGKLSESDWRNEDRRLRREAIEILKRLDELA
jgi:type II secretory pathway pseudopilin PulG